MFLTQQQVTVENPSKSVAFMVRLRLTQGTAGEDVTPILWEDNYFFLLPGEKKEVSGRYEVQSVAGKQAELELEGWNVVPSDSSAAPGGKREAIEGGRPALAVLSPCGEDVL
jgi:hypothetical protein